MLQLVYNPLIKINDEIPNSDSQQIKLDQTSLFSLNRFSGLDKQESGLRLNAGVEYAVESNGPYSYDIAVGQIFRQNPSTQFSEGSGLSGMKSDVLISGNVDYKSLIAIHGEQLFDQNLKLKHVETFDVETQTSSFANASSASQNCIAISNLIFSTVICESLTHVSHQNLWMNSMKEQMSMAFVIQNG